MGTFNRISPLLIVARNSAAIRTLRILPFPPESEPPARITAVRMGKRNSKSEKQSHAYA